MGDERVGQVLKFISHFKGARETFLHGCCYWFAWILQERFNNRGWMVDIFHDPIEGHFVARFIEDLSNEPDEPDPEARTYFFDISGNVSDIYKEEELESIDIMEITEERRWGRLMCACRELLDPPEYPELLQNS